MKANIQVAEGRVIAQIEGLKTSVDHLGGNNFIFHHDTTEAPFADDTVVVAPPTFDSSGIFPRDLP